jgi:hypothetical protein
MGKGEKKESKGDKEMKMMRKKKRKRKRNKRNGQEGAGCVNGEREEWGEEDGCREYCYENGWMDVPFVKKE